MPMVILEGTHGERQTVDVPKEALDHLNLAHDGGLYVRVGQDHTQKLEDGREIPLWVYSWDQGVRG
jgi:hypothetical protein